MDSKRKIVEFIKIVYLSVKQLLPQTDFLWDVNKINPNATHFYFNNVGKITNVKTDLSVNIINGRIVICTIDDENFSFEKIKDLYGLEFENFFDIFGVYGICYKMIDIEEDGEVKKIIVISNNGGDLSISINSKKYYLHNLIATELIGMETEQLKMILVNVYDMFNDVVCKNNLLSEPFRQFKWCKYQSKILSKLYHSIMIELSPTF